MKRRAESTMKGKAEGIDLRSLAATWRQVLLPMVAGIVTTKKALHEWVTEMGMAALVGVMEADAERVVGCRKGGQQKGRRLGLHRHAVSLRRAEGGAAAATRSHGGQEARSAIAIGDALPVARPDERQGGRPDPAGRVHAELRG